MTPAPCRKEIISFLRHPEVARLTTCQKEQRRGIRGGQVAAEGEAQAGFCSDTLPRLIRVGRGLAAYLSISPPFIYAEYQHAPAGLQEKRLGVPFALFPGT